MAIEDGAVLSARVGHDATRSPKRCSSISATASSAPRAIVNQSSENRRLFHLHSKDEIRADFAKRDEGAERNKWLYSYNPMTVELK